MQNGTRLQATPVLPQAQQRCVARRSAFGPQAATTAPPAGDDESGPASGASGSSQSAGDESNATGGSTAASTREQRATQLQLTPRCLLALLRTSGTLARHLLSTAPPAERITLTLDDDDDARPPPRTPEARVQAHERAMQLAALVPEHATFALRLIGGARDLVTPAGGAVPRFTRLELHGAGNLPFAALQHLAQQLPALREVSIVNCDLSSIALKPPAAAAAAGPSTPPLFPSTVKSLAVVGCPVLLPPDESAPAPLRADTPAVAASRLRTRFVRTLQVRTRGAAPGNSPRARCPSGHVEWAGCVCRSSSSAEHFHVRRLVPERRRC